MKIIIVGCGKVGYTLVEQLNKENHDIVVIDEREDKVRSITEELDALGIVGNGISYQTLLEADIAHADLLIAVTGSDEQNLLCCVIAKKTGKCKTIARVRNPIYSQETTFLREELGLAMIMNPELASANEIARIFQFPSAMKIDTFTKGRTELMHFKVTADCLLNGQELMKIRNHLNLNILFCTVKREDEIFIPRGNFVFREGDLVSFVATPPNANAFFKKIGYDNGKVHSVMIVGGGTMSYYLAKRLLSVGINVKLICDDKTRCEELSELLPEATLIFGDMTDQRLLLQEGIETVDGFAALTGLDEENILLSLFVKKVSSAKTVTKINRINFSGVINTLPLDSVNYPRLHTADTILKYVRSTSKSMGANMENLYSIEDGKAEALEFYIKEDSKVTGIELSKMNIKKNVLVCSILRRNNVIFPGGSETIRVGDYVVIVQAGERLNNINEILED
ncbi:MAG: Trk system potassium transporter TrkA [Acetatifactor sp.]|nr:Trk system potassium transporter TrkA [Acetatifactor sp.]